jgi:hypothetical protein
VNSLTASSKEYLEYILKSVFKLKYLILKAVIDPNMSQIPAGGPSRELSDER